MGVYSYLIVMSLEHGHFEHNTLQQPVEQTTGLGEGEKTIEKSVESIVPTEVQQKLEKSGWSDTLGDRKEAYENFSSYIAKLSPDKQQEIFQMILSANGRKLKKYTKQNGYILEKTLPDFEKYFGKKDIIETQKDNKKLSKKEESVSKKEESVSKKEESVSEKEESVSESKKLTAEHIRTKLSNFNKVFTNRDFSASDPVFQSYIAESLTVFSKGQQILSGDINSDSFDQFIEQGEQLTEKIKNHFSQTGKLEEVANTLASSSPEGIDSKEYQEFKSYAQSLDSSFTQRFTSFEKHYNIPLEIGVSDDFRQAQIVGGLGTEKYEKFGNIVEATSDQDITRMDISEVPPRRYVAVEGSNYSLETDVPIGDFYSAISNEGLEHEKKQAENTPKLEALDKLGSPEVQEFLQSSDFEQATLSGVKAILRSMIGLSVGMTLEDVCGKSFTSKEDIKNFVMSGGIASRKKQLEDQIKEKETKYKLALKQHVAEYSRKLKEKDETTRNTLRLMKQMGMDLIPQGDLQQIITEINIRDRIDLGDGIRTNTDINLAEGVYGFTDSIEGNSDREKEVLVRLFNKMVTGESSGENTLLPDVTSYATSRSIADPVVIRAELEKRNIITNTGSFNIAKVRENLWGNNTQTK